MTATFAPHRLLLVEPSETAALAIRGLLEQNGFVVEVVASATEARERDLASYALLVIDVHRREQDGLRFVHSLHRTHPHFLGRVVIISADDHSELTRELAEIGVCDIVPKPIDAQEILRAVFECLEKTPAAVH
jgi:DNA-binding response OmpR family regulator